LLHDSRSQLSSDAAAEAVASAAVGRAVFERCFLVLSIGHCGSQSIIFC